MSGRERNRTNRQTIQSISLLAYLAEHHNLWGPFLVIAPASTLHNWQQELARFVPRLKALPYWGSPKDRETLRKIWSRKNMTFSEGSPFHIIVTSYQLVRPFHFLLHFHPLFIPLLLRPNTSFTSLLFVFRFFLKLK